MTEPKVTNITYLGLPPEYVEAVERLRGECRQLREDFKDGYACGQAWALTFADYPQLRNFADTVASNGGNPEGVWWATEIVVRDDLRKRAASQGTVSETQWRYGFIKGVMAVWQTIHDFVEEGDPLYKPKFRRDDD